MADIKFNTEAIKGMYQEVAKAIDALDEDVRKEYTGRPVEEITEPIRKMFADAGVQLDVSEYAAAVAEDKPFQFVVQ
ncbi:MAG: hypothetical protein LKI93_04680 [Bifidobacteriaceae bacterium]|jgi:hypothetical protein|nr:hypothetical protein [Bifidobacteriaceae bacterium]MCI1914919.1 hypothetical protein [Bifidobacteriaceae bacterium]